MVTSLSTLLNGTQQSFFNNTSFPRRSEIWFFRVYSNNDNLADALVISAVSRSLHPHLPQPGRGWALVNVRRRQYVASLPPKAPHQPCRSHRLARRRQAFYGSDVINVQGTDDNDFHITWSELCSDSGLHLQGGWLAS